MEFVKTGWKDRELKTRPQPLTKTLHPEVPEEQEEDATKARSEESAGPSPSERLNSLVSFFRRNLMAIVALVTAVVVSFLAGLLLTKPRQRKPKNPNNNNNNNNNVKKAQKVSNGGASPKQRKPEESKE